MELNLHAASTHMAAVEFNFYYHKFEILPFAKMGENSTGSMLKPLAYLFSFMQRKCSFSTRAQRTLEIILNVDRRVVEKQQSSKAL